MTRNHLTGLLLAASTLTLGTLAAVVAQDGEEEAHDHEHTPTTVHAADGSAFEIDNEEAYPDADGFQNMDQRVSYAIGRVDGQQASQMIPEFDPETYLEGINQGMEQEDEDFVIGYSEGYGYAQRVLAQAPEDLEMDAFLEGFVAAVREEDPARSFGFLRGYNYQASELPIDTDTYLAGITEGLSQLEYDQLLAAYNQAVALAEAQAAAGGEAEIEVPDEPEAVETRLSQEQVGETLQAFEVLLANRERDEAIAEAEAYIAGLTEEDGWQRTESGMVYKVEQEGEGESPDVNDICTVHYRGSLLDDTVFDSSYDRGQPAQFAPNRVIAGWTEMLQIMKPGQIVEVVIPYNLAYGEQGNPPRIPGYSALRFRIELISFVPVANDVPVLPPAPGQ